MKKKAQNNYNKMQNDFKITTKKTQKHNRNVKMKM